jgi:hypothetical protein
VLVHCLADSGAAETYTEDGRKMVVPPQQKVMSFLWYWSTKEVIQLQYGEQAAGRQSMEQWVEKFQETGNVLLEVGSREA